MQSIKSRSWFTRFAKRVSQATGWPDELIHATDGAHNALLDREELDEQALRRIQANYERLANATLEALERGGSDTRAPDVDAR